MGGGALGEDHPGPGPDGPPRHVGVLAAAQAEGVVEHRLDTLCDLGGEEEAARRGVVDEGAGRMATASEQRLVDPSRVAPLEHRLDHAVDHVGPVPAQRLDHVGQPARLDGHVVVQEGDELAWAGALEGPVAGRSDAWPGFPVVADRKRAAASSGDLSGRALRAVVDDDHPDRAPARDLELLERPEEAGEGLPAPVGDDAHRHVDREGAGGHPAAVTTGRPGAPRRDSRTATAAHSEAASTTSAQ